MINGMNPLVRWRKFEADRDQPWPWCMPPPGGGSVWPCSRCVDTSGQMCGLRGPRLRIPDWKKLVAGTLNYPQTETGPYQILVMSYVRTQPMRAAGSKRMDSERPHIATYVLSPGWLSLSDHYSGDGTQKKD